MTFAGLGSCIFLQPHSLSDHPVDLNILILSHSWARPMAWSSTAGSPWVARITVSALSFKPTPPAFKGNEHLLDRNWALVMSRVRVSWRRSRDFKRSHLQSVQLFSMISNIPKLWKSKPLVLSLICSSNFSKAIYFTFSIVVSKREMAYHRLTKDASARLRFPSYCDWVPLQKSLECDLAFASTEPNRLFLIVSQFISYGHLYQIRKFPADFTFSVSW